jgi:2,3-bisphosphoglycerate-independent phosphoglycerate mutase
MIDEEDSLKNEIIENRPIVFLTLDGWGVTQPSDTNPITQANTPYFDKIINSYPTMTLLSSGQAIGSYWGSNSNKKIGYEIIGTGEVNQEPYLKITNSIKDGSFFKNNEILKTLNHIRQYNSSLHLIGLISEGNIHSSLDHLYALLKLAKEKNIVNVFIHAILDGIDVPKNSGQKTIAELEKYCKEIGVGKIASISGRKFGMDSDYNWDKTKLFVDILIKSKSLNSFSTTNEIFEHFYKKEIFDYDLPPSQISHSKLSQNDGIIAFNFTPNSLAQSIKALLMPVKINENKEKSTLKKNIQITTLTHYNTNLPVYSAFQPQKPTNCISQVISANKLKQLHLGHTPTFNYITYFFNGQNAKPYQGENWIIIPTKSQLITSSSEDIDISLLTDKILESIQNKSYDCIFASYCSADIAAKSKDFDKTKKAIESIDKSLEKIVKQVLGKNGIIFITSTNGNAENLEISNTSNPVPFIIISNNLEGKSAQIQEPIIESDLSLLTPQGVLADIPVTFLKLLNIRIPETMIGKNLLEE